MNELEFVPNRKLLYVDDEENLLSSFKSLLRKENYDVYLLNNPLDIESVLNKEGPFALVLSDQRMPGIDGVNLLKKVSQAYPETFRVLITGFSDHNETIQAINVGGISRYINKPWDDNELKNLIRYYINQFNLSSQNIFLFNHIKVQKEKLTELLNGTIGQISRLLIDMLSHINQHAAKQTEAVKFKGLFILDHFPEISEEERWDITRSLELFNIGYALIPTWIQVSLNKEGLNAAKRFSACREIYKLSAYLLSTIPRFQKVAKILNDLQSVYNKELSPADASLGVKILKILVDIEIIGTSNFYGDMILKDFLRTPGKYDPDIVKILLNYSENTITNDDIGKFYIKELKEGMVTFKDIVTKSGTILIQANSKLTTTSIKALRSWNLSDGIVEPVLIKYPKKNKNYFQLINSPAQ